MSANLLKLQRNIQDILDRAVKEGTETAVQVAAYLRGMLIVDAWAAPAGRRIDGRSLFPIFSTGKGIAATAIHRLVERGVLHWDDPIAKRWPAFAAHGKAGIALRHALNHTAGLPMLPAQGAMSDTARWDAMCDFLASSEPLHPAGARRHYHAVTYSWLVGEPARRADGRDFGEIVAQEVCSPLGLDGLCFGGPVSEAARCVDAERVTPPSLPPTSSPPPPPDPVAARAAPDWMMPLEDWINRDDIRRACVPASNGFADARSLARHYAALVGPGVDGVRLLREATVDAATRWDPVSDGGLPGAGRWALGYSMQGPDDAPGAVFGHGGYGGSIAFADRRCSLAVGYVRSRMGGSSALDEVLRTIRAQAGM